MARISTYAKDANITSSDKLLGSNYQGLDNQGRPIFTTANFKVEDLLTYFQDNISIGGENFNQVAADLGKLKSNYIYDENGNISGLSSAFVDIIASSDVSDNYATASFQTNMEANVLTFDGQGGYTVSAAFANSVITTTSSDRFATSEFVNNLGSSFGTVGIDGSVTISEAFANSVISTQTSGDLATAAFVNNLATSIGTVDAEGNVTVSEAFANSVMQTESATDYAQASFVNNLASSIGTVDINGNVTVSESFANSVMNTENTTDYAQAQFVNNIASSIGTVDAEGNITVSESFANSVMQTENTTDYASAQSVTDLSATVSTKPDIFRQDDAPATTVALGSLWYETDNNNALHVLVDVDGTSTWTLTDDERIGTLVDSTATINQTLNTQADDISNNATFATNLAGSFGTYDAQGNLTGLSEAFANDVFNTTTSENFASAQSVTDLTATVNTKPDIFRQATEPSTDNAIGSLWYDTGNNNQVYVLVDGTPKVWTLTDDSRIGTLVDSTATINQTLQSQATDIGNNATFATGLAGSFGTYDSSTGELTSLSEAFANDVFSTTTSTNFASSQSVTDLTSAVDAKPDVFRQTTEPSTDNAIGSIWYDTTNDANLPYVLVDVSGTKTWVATGDKRIVTNASSISNVSDSLSTTNSAVSAAADKITELETQFTFDTEGNISGVADTLSQSISTAQSDAESASASKVDTLAATFYTGYDNADGTFTALNISEAFANEVFDTTTSTNFASTDSVNTLSSAVSSKPDVFRQGGTTDGEPATTGAVGSLWYDTEDNNKVYILIDNQGTKEWAESTDGRVVTNANSISTVSDSLSTTNDNLSAAADKITELETQFTFDTEGDITGTSGTLNTEISTAESNATSAAASKVETLAANFFTGYDAGDGSLTGVSFSDAVQTAISGVISTDGYAAANDLETLEVTVQGTDGTGGLVGSVSTLQNTIASKPEVFRSGTQPAVTEPVGSLWFDTANGNKAYILASGNPNTWEEAADTNIISSIADKPFIFRQGTTQPAITNPVGSLWYDTDADNKLYVLTAGDPDNTWEATVDGTIATAQSAAETAQDAAEAAQSTANSRPKVFRQTTAPDTTEPEYSIWYDTTDGANTAYVLINGTWEETLDGRVGDLLDFVESSYAISTDANGVVTGMELYSRSGANSTLSEVKFTADKFVIKSSTVEATPFVLDSNSLKLNVPLNGVSGSFSGNLEAAGGTFRGAVDILDSDNDTVVKIHSGGLGNAIAVSGQSATFPNVSQITVDTWDSSDNVSTTGATISSLYDDTNQIIYGPAQSVTFAAGSYTHAFSTNASAGDVVTNSSDAYGFSRVNLGIQFGNSDFSTIYYDQIFPNVNVDEAGSAGIPAVPSFNISLAFAQQTTVYVRLYVKRTWKLQMGSISFTSRTISIASDMAFAGKKGKAEMSPDGIKIFNTDDIYFKIDRANFTSGNPYVDIAGDVKIDGDLEITGDVNFSGDINNSDVTVANLQNRLSEIAGNTYIGSSAGTATFTVRDNLVVDGSLTVNGTTTTVNTSNLSVSDNLIHVADNNNLNTIDLGIVGHYSADNGVTANHVGVFWDASASNWKFFDNYTKDEVNTATVDTSHNSFSLAEVQASGFKVADGQLGFLKADGSIDTDTYVTSDHNHDGVYLKLSTGGTIAGNVSFGDGIQARFGAGNDLNIYHSGTHSYIRDSGEGNLYIGGSNLVWIGTGDFQETSAIFNTNGSVQLRHDNSTKFETTSTGVTITGDATATTFIGALQGNADTATWADTVDVNVNNNFTGTYALVWHYGDTLYSSNILTVNGSTDTLNIANISSGDVTLSGDLRGSEAHSLIYDFIADGSYEEKAFYNPDTFNAYAGADHWANITLTNAFASDRTSTVSLIGEGPFNYGGNTFSPYFNAAEDEMVIEIDHTSQPLKHHAIVGIQFTNTGWRANRIKIEAYNGTAWSTGLDTNSNTATTASAKFSLGGAGIQKLKITLGDPQNSTGGYIRISKIFGYDYQGVGSRSAKASGTYYIEKYRDNSHYSNIYPELDSTYSLGTTSKRYSNVYSDNFVGDLTGNITGNANTVDLLHADDFTLDRVTGFGNTTDNDITVAKVYSDQLRANANTNSDFEALRLQNGYDDDLATSNPSVSIQLFAASNNGYLRVHGAPADTASKHQIDLGSTAGSSFVTLSPASTEVLRATSTEVSVTGDLSATGDVTANHYFADTHFRSIDTAATLSTTGAGTVYLRPNGYSSTSGQAYLQSNGNFLFSGNLITSGSGLYTSGNGSKYIQLGAGRTDNGYAYIDLVGDATYDDYGLRIIRNNGGENTTSQIIHRGTGSLQIVTNEAAPISFKTAGVERFKINGAGGINVSTNVTFGEGDRIIFPDNTSIPDNPTNEQVDYITFGLHGSISQVSGRGALMITSSDDSLILANGEVGRTFVNTNIDADAEGVVLLSDGQVDIYSDLQDGWDGSPTPWYRLRYSGNALTTYDGTSTYTYWNSNDDANFVSLKIGNTTVINSSRQLYLAKDNFHIDAAAVTTTAAELNILDGATVTTAELNKLDNFTGTYEDLNYAKNLRATGVDTIEFSHLNNVTSNIQTQINNIDAFKYKSVADIEPADGYVSLFEMKTPSANLKGGSNALVYVRTRWVGSTSSVKTSCFFNITASEDGLITVEANSAEGSNVRYKIIQDNAYPSNYIFQIKSMLASALDVECFMFETTKKGSSGSGEIITTGFSTYTTPKEHDIYEFSGKRFISFDNSVTGTTTIDTGVTIDGSLTVNSINLTGLSSTGGRTTQTETVLISSSGGTYPGPLSLAELPDPGVASARSFMKFTVFGGGEFLEKKYVCDWNDSASEWEISVATEESSGKYDVQYDFTNDDFKLHIVDGSTTLTYNAVTVTLDHLGEDIYYNWTYSL